MDNVLTREPLKDGFRCWWLAGLLMVLAGCVEQQETPNAVNDDTTARQLAEIKLGLNQGGAASQRAIQRLVTLHKAQPSDQKTHDLVVAMLVAREDWPGLIQVLRAMPSSLRTDSSDVELATILVKDHQYAEALSLVNQGVDAAGHSDDARLAWIAAFSAFHLGELDRATAILDANREAFLAEGHVDLHYMRGTLFFRSAQFEDAERELRVAVKLTPDMVKAHDALGRVLLAQGKQAEAEACLARAAEIRERKDQQFNQQMRLSKVAKALDAAFAEQRYDECEGYIDELMPHVGASNRIKLYQYLAAIRAAQGKSEAAQAAVIKARELQKSTEVPQQGGTR